MPSFPKHEDQEIHQYLTLLSDEKVIRLKGKIAYININLKLTVLDNALKLSSSKIFFAGHVSQSENHKKIFR